MFNVQIAIAKILLAQPIFVYLFNLKIFEFDFFLLIFAAFPTPLGGLVMHNWRVVSSYFLNGLGNALCLGCILYVKLAFCDFRLHFVILGNIL